MYGECMISVRVCARACAPLPRSLSLLQPSEELSLSLHLAVHPAPEHRLDDPPHRQQPSRLFRSHLTPPPRNTHALPSLWDATPLHSFPENTVILCRSSSLMKSSMPDSGTAAAAAAGAAAAAAASSSSSGDGSDSARHRHRPQQGEAERPDPCAAPQQSSSGVLGESLGCCGSEEVDRWCSRRAAASLPLSPPGRPKNIKSYYRPVNMGFTYHFTAALNK